MKNPGTYNKKDIKYTVYNGDILRVDMNGTVELEGGLGTTYVRAEVGGAYVIFTFHVVDTTAPDPVKIKYNDTMTEKVDRAFTIKAGEWLLCDLRCYRCRWHEAVRYPDKF